jgi:RNA polymerase sigma factor (sigma-70 family)
MMGVVEHAAVSDVSMGDSQKAPSAAFEAFYVAELPGQVRRAYLLVGSDEAANDIVHEAMVSVYRDWHRIAQPGAYLNRAVLNGCREHHRRVQRSQRLVSRIAASPLSAPPENDLTDVLAALPFPQRAAVVLRYFEQRSTADIAEALNCSVGSVGPWINRAIKKMREALS